MTMETKNLADLYDLAPLDWKPVDAKRSRRRHQLELRRLSCSRASVS